MSVLRKTSKTTSHEQLKTVLQEALSRGHIKRADTKEAADSVIADLENPESELRKTMANLKPLQYVWHVHCGVIKMTEQIQREPLVQTTK